MTVRTPDQSTAAAKAQSLGKGPHYVEGQCLKAVREAARIGPHDYTPGNGHDPWAIEAWDHARFRHPGNVHPPEGAFVFWRGRPGRPGHIALSAGDQKIWSTDAVRKGYFHLVDLDWPAYHWGLAYQGWTEDLNGVRVDLVRGVSSQPSMATPLAVVKAPTRAALVANFADAHDLGFVEIARLALRAAAARNSGARLKNINAARAALKGMK